MVKRSACQPRKTTALATLLNITPKISIPRRRPQPSIAFARGSSLPNNRPPRRPILSYSSQRPAKTLECVEIARRIRALAAQGRPVRSHRHSAAQCRAISAAGGRSPAPRGHSRLFQPRRARPDPAGRAFLALLACACDGCSASRFAEYLSLGQLPPVDQNGASIKPVPQWVPPDDEILANFASAPPAPDAARRG